jgi:hypothetical protein
MDAKTLPKNYNCVIQRAHTHTHAHSPKQKVRGLNGGASLTAAMRRGLPVFPVSFVRAHFYEAKDSQGIHFLFLFKFHSIFVDFIGRGGGGGQVPGSYANTSLAPRSDRRSFLLQKSTHQIVLKCNFSAFRIKYQSKNDRNGIAILGP